MTDVSKPATAGEFQAAGVDPETAAWAAAAHEAQMGRGDALAPILRNAPSTQTVGDAASAQARLDALMKDRAAGTISDWEWRSKYEPEVLALRDKIVSGSGSDLAHLEQLYQPPRAPWDYKVPAALGEVTDEARAADSALVSLLHTERMPLDLGNALMADLARGRPVEHSAETISALRPWAEQMLRSARANPALRAVTEGASADQLLAIVSPETAVSLLPWLKHRSSRTL